MKNLSKYLMIMACIILMAACTKETIEEDKSKELLTENASEKTSETELVNEEANTEEANKEEVNTEEVNTEKANTDEDKSPEVINEENNKVDEEERITIDIDVLKNTPSVITESIYLSPEANYIVYLKNIDNKDILLYEDLTTEKAIEVMAGIYGITFQDIEGTESDIIFKVIYPNGDTRDLMIAIDLIKRNSLPDLYSVDPVNYMKALLSTESIVPSRDSYINNDYAIYYNQEEYNLSMWTPEDGIFILDEDMGAYTDFAVSPNENFIALTAGTSASRELIVVDSESKAIIYRNGPVYDSLYWSLDSKYLAFNILNSTIINPNLEIDVSMDIGLLYMEDLSGRRIAKGTKEHYMLVEGFRDIGLDVYEADKDFQKTTGYTILNEEIEESKDLFIDIDDDSSDEEEFTLLEFDLGDEYINKRLNDAIKQMNDTYIIEGKDVIIPIDYVAVASKIDKYDVEDFISLFFTFKYRNTDGNEIYLYDSITYEVNKGVIINFDTMFKAEEIENVFSQMLIDEVLEKQLILTKEYTGFNDDADFYFTEEGIVVYYGPGLYTNAEEGPLYIKLLWEDLKGVIELGSLVY